MRFKDPLLLMLIPLALYLILAKKKRTEPAITFSSGELLTVFDETYKVKLFKSLRLLRAFSAILIVCALARPQSVLVQSITTTKGINIILVVDVSSSMLSEDFSHDSERKNRLEAAKAVMKEFVRSRNGDKIGMVVFASRAYAAAPLTLDHDWLIENLARIETGMIEDGTAIGSGIMSALNCLKNAKAKNSVVILLTDGRNNAGDIPPVVAAEAAHALNIKVYTIGVGSKMPAVYPVEDIFGNTILKQADARVDEEMLNTIASRTGARYFRATDQDALNAVYKEIDRLEKSTIEEKVYYQYTELFHLFLMAALLLVIIEVILKNTALRNLP